MQLKTTITKVFEFDAAHWLDHHDGKCSQMHGHTYKLEVTVEGKVKSLHEGGSQAGMIMDFGKLKGIVNKNVIDLLDHSLLNDHFDYTTAEFMAQDIFERLYKAFTPPPHLPGFTPEEWPVPVRIRLWETPTSYVEVTNGS